MDKIAFPKSCACSYRRVTFCSAAGQNFKQRLETSYDQVEDAFILTFLTSIQALIPLMFQEANFLFHVLPPEVFASDLKSNLETSGIAVLLLCFLASCSNTTRDSLRKLVLPLSANNVKRGFPQTFWVQVALRRNYGVRKLTLRSIS